ncbi:IS630 family transposase [bacterium]|nr:IS630 family transposase [bacterium]
MKPFPIPNPDHAGLLEIDLNYRAASDFLLAIRLQAIKMLTIGITVDQVCQVMSRTRSTLRSWVHLWNEGGIDALARKRGQGRSRKISPGHMRIISELVEHPDRVNREFWTAKCLHGYIQEQFQLALGYSTLTRNLREDDFRRLVPRPESPERNPQLRGEFTDRLLPLLNDPLAEVWFGDETGFLADPRPKARWAKRGTTPVCPKTGLHIRESVVGAACPKTGEFAGLIVNAMDREVFQIFLDYLSDQVNGRRIVLVVDNASWHKSNLLNWHNITPMYLPPYSPDLNPIERLWLVMKDKFFTNFYTKERNKLIDRITDAVLHFMDHRSVVKSICNLKVD